MKEKVDPLDYPGIPVYLSAVENYLHSLSVEERHIALDEITERIGHYLIIEPNLSVEEIIKNLGGIKAIANHYLIKNQKPFHRIKRWMPGHYILLFFLTTTCLFILSLTLSFYFLRPVVEIKNDKILFLGGSIKIDNQFSHVATDIQGHFSPPTPEIIQELKHIFQGSADLVDNSIEDLRIDFYQGHLELSFSDEPKITWDCKLQKKANNVLVKEHQEMITVDLRKYKSADCDFTLPAKLKYTVEGLIGKVDLLDPSNDVFIKLSEGSINISPSPELKYLYDLEVTDGIMDEFFNSSSDSSGIEIKVELESGIVRKI